MKIGIIALTFLPGQSGGIETYFRDLIESLQRIDKTNEYTIILKPEQRGTISIENQNFKICYLNENFLSKAVRKLRLTTLLPNLTLAGQIAATGIDVAHFPLQVIYPFGLQIPTVLSFMDMQQEFLPEFFSPEDIAARKATYLPSCQAASHIIAISNHTKETLVDRYRMPQEKITTVHLAHNSRLYDGSKTKLSVDLPRPYFYYPAATWPHKNHKNLLEAFSIVHRSRPQFCLVLSGIKKQGADSIDELISNKGLKKYVHRLGYLPYEDLRVWHSSA
jgi:glycosyltransferase involved in cell wall biosynthesis